MENTTHKYAVIRSLSSLSSPMIEATDLDYSTASGIASASGDRAEVAPMGRASTSYMDKNGVHVWHVVPSSKNPKS